MAWVSTPSTLPAGEDVELGGAPQVMYHNSYFANAGTWMSPRADIRDPERRDDFGTSRNSQANGGSSTF